MASTLSGPLNLDLPLPFKTGTTHSLSFAPLHTDIIGTLPLSPRVCRWECGLSIIMDQLPPFAAHQLKAILSEDLSVQLLKVLSLSSPLPVYVWHESAVNCCSQKVLLRERLRAELLQGSVSRLVIFIKMSSISSKNLLTMRLASRQVALVLRDRALLVPVSITPGSATLLLMLQIDSPWFLSSQSFIRWLIIQPNDLVCFLIKR